ncbi:hypothetical protein TNCV_4004601 [Trichonephila clavipes]|nr:hypothetical protein TNCV_4004601 [Trichonephila clavipes]
MSRGVATTVSAISMIRSPQAIGAPTCVTAVPLTSLSFLKKGSEGVLKWSPLRADYAIDHQTKLLRYGIGQNGNYFHKEYKSFETCNFSRKFEKIANKNLPYKALENPIAKLTLYCCPEPGIF